MSHLFIAFACLVCNIQSIATGEKRVYLTTVILLVRTAPHRSFNESIWILKQLECTFNNVQSNHFAVYKCNTGISSGCFYTIFIRHFLCSCFNERRRFVWLEVGWSIQFIDFYRDIRKTNRRNKWDSKEEIFEYDFGCVLLELSHQLERRTSAHAKPNPHFFNP